MKTAAEIRKEFWWGAFIHGAPIVSNCYRWLEPRWRNYVEKRQVSFYDDRTHTFQGVEDPSLIQRNYEKSLRHIWKAEVAAPYLGIRDATDTEKLGAEAETSDSETRALMERATSDVVRREFEEAFSPRQREAVCRLMSLIAHGEAYALYTSSTLLPFVEGTGAKMGMAMQVMEEAKHFYVLRAMIRTLGRSYPLADSAKILFENVARAKPYRKLFGMNVMLESFATSLFAQFAEYPGLRHILHEFHLDESRHVGFPKSYFEAGHIPHEVSHSTREKIARGLLLLPAASLIWDYKEDFEAVGVDCFAFWGRFISKASRLAESSGFPLYPSRKEFLFSMNLILNGYLKAFEPDRFAGYRDYTKLRDEDLPEEMARIEREVFGDDVFDGVESRPAASAN